MDNPYLVGGKKFDLRIYALVMGYSPLRIYLYRWAAAGVMGLGRGRLAAEMPADFMREGRERRGMQRPLRNSAAPPLPPPPPRTRVRRSGFARFTNARFSMRKEDIGNTFVHLTNVAIQKHAPGFDRSKGMKWPIRSLRLYLSTRHGERAAGCVRRCAPRSGTGTHARKKGSSPHAERVRPTAQAASGCPRMSPQHAHYVTLFLIPTQARTPPTSCLAPSRP